ncbi:UNVERIFIED_CONTAM: hypothetical protein HDU68_007488 [Siphonaria sp. JEL0065]|nr:hypothetical protein HDU68_007488 [Siphonaria sp. JEL0065]
MSEALPAETPVENIAAGESTEKKEGEVVVGSGVAVVVAVEGIQTQADQPEAFAIDAEAKAKAQGEDVDADVEDGANEGEEAGEEAAHMDLDIDAVPVEQQQQKQQQAGADAEPPAKQPRGVKRAREAAASFTDGFGLGGDNRNNRVELGRGARSRSSLGFSQAASPGSAQAASAKASIKCPVEGCKRVKLIASQKQLYFHMRDCHSTSISVKFRNKTATVTKSDDGLFHCLGCEKQFASPSSLRTHASKCSVSHLSLMNSSASASGSIPFAALDLPLYDQHLNYRTFIHQLMPSYITLPDADKISIKKQVTTWLEDQMKHDFGDCIVLSNHDGKSATLSVPDFLVEDFKSWAFSELQKLFPSAKLRKP